MKTLRLQDWPTRQLVWPALTILIAACIIDAVNWPLKVQFGVPYRPLEYLSTGMAMLGWGFLLLLLPVAAFRPDTRFSLKGGCDRRAKTFAVVLGANLAVFVAMAAITLAAW